MMHLVSNLIRNKISQSWIVALFGHLFGRFVVSSIHNTENLQICRLRRFAMVKLMDYKNSKERFYLVTSTVVLFMITFTSQRKMNGKIGLIYQSRKMQISSLKILKFKILSLQQLIRFVTLSFKNIASKISFLHYLLDQLVQVNLFIFKMYYFNNFQERNT